MSFQLIIKVEHRVILMTKYTTNIQVAEFDKNGLAIVEGWAEVYLCHSKTREFLGKSYDRVPSGFSVVADAYLDAPELPKSNDIAVCRAPDGKSWVHQADYRGKKVYHTETRQAMEIGYIGALKPSLINGMVKNGLQTRQRSVRIKSNKLNTRSSVCSNRRMR
ncbi:hypothetical protein [Xenorhabdus budapestensis]|uniref:Tail fiber protein of a prophage n=1 Tax=Xenorhabdus budapestensis TaxID=290110 RepID=A0A2D0IN86_XENBU|nr:hypothetical protein [Xenorhabdus budapestensis]PHM23259.1 tail fiber protein of a prophage [Xenorhabdus budapestensis]